MKTMDMPKSKTEIESDNFHYLHLKTDNFLIDIL